MSLARIGVLVGSALGLSYLTTGSFWPFGKKEESKEKDKTDDVVGYDDISDTSMVDLEGVGKVRFFDPDVTATILQNLAGAYVWDETGTFKPAVGASFSYIQHYDPVGYPPPGARAFDWVQQAVDSGFYVAMVAQAGSGPWSQVDGNNMLLALRAEDLTKADIVNDWAIVAVPGSLSAALAALPTEDLIEELGKA